jgi:ribulose-phosphate 3-epimerase
MTGTYYSNGFDIFFSHFVPNITMGPPVLASVYKTVPNVFMDCHMMVADPARVCLRL